MERATDLSALLWLRKQRTAQSGQMVVAQTPEGEATLKYWHPEAHRIRLAYLFDQLLAVHTSLVEPLPHQITAVYGEMLPRQPLRFLLADAREESAREEFDRAM